MCIIEISSGRSACTAEKATRLTRQKRVDKAGLSMTVRMAAKVEKARCCAWQYSRAASSADGGVFFEEKFDVERRIGSVIQNNNKSIDLLYIFSCANVSGKSSSCNKAWPTSRFIKGVISVPCRLSTECGFEMTS